MSDALPMILAGPVLRRVSSDCITLWLATRERPGSLDAGLYQLTGAAFDMAPIHAQVDAETVSLGAQLHVSLLQLRVPDAALPRDVLLAYDIAINGMTLEPLGLTRGEHSIVYDGMSLPTFFLPKEGADSTHILHGSCRKLHGEDDDALLIADQVIAEHLTQLDRRPSALFLSGDQIYADDVGAPLIKPLAELARDIAPNEPQVPDVPYPTTRIALNSRASLMKDKAGFSSGAAANHLITFGEYAAMHLMAWNAQLWPERFPSATQLFRVTDPTKVHDVEQNQRNFRIERERLEQTRAALPSVRRAMANIPCYMIFDDHEVTDDWNIDKAWHDRVGGKPAGRRIVANALAAYWAFQGWGNMPEVFDGAFKSGLQGFLDGTSGDGGAYEAQLRDFPNWAYVAPTQPPTLVLNTRTRRRMGDGRYLPRLMDEGALAQLPELVRQAGHTPGEPLTVISPAPLLGLAAIDELQSKIHAAGTDASTIDFEDWAANTKGMAEFLKCLVRDVGAGRCVVLSGDVHYGFGVKGTFSWNGADLSLVQLTSSAFKNTGFVNKSIVTRMDTWRANALMLGWDSQPASPVWDQLRQQVERPGATPPADVKYRYRRMKRLLTEDEAVILTATDRQAFGISEDPHWQLHRNYLVTGSGDVVIGENNMALIRIGADGAVDHVLMTRRNGGVVSYPASVA